MQTKSPSLKRPQIYAVRGGNIWAKVSVHVDKIFKIRIFDEKIKLWRNLERDLLTCWFRIHVTEP